MDAAPRRQVKPGRKPGSGNKKRSEAILKREFGSGEIMPLDVMLSEMRSLLLRREPTRA